MEDLSNDVSFLVKAIDPEHGCPSWRDSEYREQSNQALCRAYSNAHKVGIDRRGPTVAMSTRCYEGMSSVIYEAALTDGKAFSAGLPCWRNEVSSLTTPYVCN